MVSILIDNYPAILGLLISSLWLLSNLNINQAIVKWLKKNIKDERKILLPSAIFILSPFIFTYLFNYLYSLQQEGQLIEIFRAVFPVFSFILGQLFTEYRKQEENRDRERTAIIEIIDKFSDNCQILRDNKEQLESSIIRRKIAPLEKYYDETTLMPLEDLTSNLLKLRLFQGLIKEEKRQASDGLIIAANFAVNFTKEFNKNLEDRKYANEKLKQFDSNNTNKVISENASFDEEKSCEYRVQLFREKSNLDEIDNKLLQIIEQLLDIHDKFNQSLYGKDIYR